ncbi:MAG: Gfo/Idh/MocA family oxidoreductase [Fidelibacterota bacterium]|nr:MAG: Gfo/Idh/MocA family oxidoreductase [Candidatus Neomarinimicrobiota bacterium]
MSKKLRIGFIGTGNFARKVHYPSLARIESAEIAAICENTHIERLDEVARQYGIGQRYQDYQDMLDKADLDAVYAIMRPTYGLAEVACDVLAAGKPLFIEKPPALSVEEMRTMAEAAESSGCGTQVGFNRRFIPVLVEARRQVTERGLCSITGTFYKHELKDDWLPGRKLLTNGIHAVDTLRWLADSEPREVVAATSKGFTKGDNCWQALIRFENGVVGSLLTNYSAGARVHTFEIHGKGISAFIDPDESAVIYADGDRKSPQILGAKEFAGSDEFIEYYGLRAENQHFVDSILAGKKPMPDFQDALKTMELVAEIEKGQI